uniref:TolC family protein n=1 Tax=Ignavibacterium album TaxID=591197 RepID=A0A7V3E7N3_9BACT
MLSFAKSLFAGRQSFALFILVLAVSILNAQERIDKELTLNEAIKIGLKNNPEIKSAQQNISAAKGRFWSGISLPAPEIGVSYEYTPVNKSLRNFSERTFEVSQSFEFPSNYFLRGSKFSKEEEIAFYGLKQTEIGITAQIKSAYYNVLAKKDLLGIAEENLKIAEDFSKKAEIRYNVGEGTNLERLTAKVQFTEAKNNLEVASNELRTAFAELNFYLGYGKRTDEIFTLADSLTYLPSDKFTFEELYNLSLSVNQQIKISELNVSTASINKSLAWSSLLPNFNLGYFKQTRDGDNGFYGASFGISVPLWFLFENRGQIQEATANVNIAESELQLIKNDVYLRLRSAFNNYENELRQVNLYISDILPQAEEVYRSASASYDAGEITYIEFLQARQTLIGAYSNYTNVLFNYYRSIFTLEETVGQNLLK